MTAVLLLALPFAQMMGGYTPYQPSEIAAGSHVHSLAAFAITTLATQSNSLDLQGLEFGSLDRAEHQTVAGTNYRGTVHMLPQGIVTFTVWEQTWTNSLSLTAATFSPSSVSNARLDLLGGQALSLDAAAFADFEANLAQRSGVHKQCDGGQQWNECGSSCTPTCDSPSPMCAMVCVAKCECPRDKPIFENGRCIAQAACTTTQPATATATSFNCLTREMWSAKKTQWCCAHRNLGCPTTVGANGHGQYHGGDTPVLGANGHGQYHGGDTPVLGANGHGQHHGGDGASVPGHLKKGGDDDEQPPALGASRSASTEPGASGDPASKSVVADQSMPTKEDAREAQKTGSLIATSPAASALCILVAIVAAGSVGAVLLRKRRCLGAANGTRLADDVMTTSKAHEMSAPSAISATSNIA